MRELNVFVNAECLVMFSHIMYGKVKGISQSYDMKSYIAVASNIVKPGALFVLVFSRNS